MLTLKHNVTAPKIPDIIRCLPQVLSPGERWIWLGTASSDFAPPVIMLPEPSIKCTFICWFCFGLLLMKQPKLEMKCPVNETHISSEVNLESLD